MGSPPPRRGVRGLGQQGEQNPCDGRHANTNQPAQSIGDEFPLETINNVGTAPWGTPPRLIARCGADAVRPLCSSAKEWRESKGEIDEPCDADAAHEETNEVEHLGVQQRLEDGTKLGSVATTLARLHCLADQEPDGLLLPRLPIGERLRMCREHLARKFL